MLTAFIAVIAVGSFLNPTTNVVGFLSPAFWPTVGVHLIVLSLAALIASVAGIRWGPRRLSLAASAAAGLALFASTTICLDFVRAVVKAGGSASLLSGLRLTSLSAGTFDARETFTVVDGKALHVAIYRPRQSAEGAPVFLYIHGGGWISGGEQDDPYRLRWFANRGWLVMSAEYRLASNSQPAWDRAPKDVACALDWVAKNSSRFVRSRGPLVVAGDSSGGNLAINLAYAAASGQAQSGCGTSIPVPDAVVAYYPVVDPQDAYDHGYPAPSFEPQMFVSRYIGGSPHEHPDRMKAISSATYLSAKVPPTLIVEPENDGLIPSAGVFHFIQQARATGAPVTLARIPFAGHAFDSVAGNSIGNQAALSITEHYLRESISRRS